MNHNMMMTMIILMARGICLEHTPLEAVFTLRLPSFFSRYELYHRHKFNQFQLLVTRNVNAAFHR